MKHDCDIVRDLMPLYVDGTASEKSRAMVEEHVGECEPCREMLDEMRQEVPAEPPTRQADKLVKKIRLRRWLRNAVLVLMGVVISAVLAVAGWRGWNYYFNDMSVLSAEDSYNLEVVQGVYGTEIVVTVLDGHAQVPNEYFDAETGDLYLWNTTTRLPVPTKSVREVRQALRVYYAMEIGYGYVVIDYDDEAEQWNCDVVPIRRIIKGAPAWYPNAIHPGKLMYEAAESSAEALTEQWRERMEETGVLDEWRERMERWDQEFIQESANEDE